MSNLMHKGRLTPSPRRVRGQKHSKSHEQILMKFSGYIDQRSRKSINPDGLWCLILQTLQAKIKATGLWWSQIFDNFDTSQAHAHTGWKEKRSYYVRLLCQVCGDRRMCRKQLLHSWGHVGACPPSTWKYRFLVTCSTAQLTKMSLKIPSPLTGCITYISNILSLHVNKEKNLA